MDLVPEDATLPFGGPTPSSIWIVMVPGGQQTAVDDQVPALDQTQSEQSRHQGDEDQEVG